MKTLKENQLKREANYLKKLYTKFGRVNQKFQELLEKRGYVLCDLGTSNRCYTCSGDVGIKYFANDSDSYFGIGVYNISKKTRSGISVQIYRAWVKKVEA